MNLLSSQSYSELAEDTNIENLPDKRRGQLKRDLLLYQINQMDSNSKYIKKTTFLHLIWIVVIIILLHIISLYLLPK